jgi:hypothetical protein
MELTIGDGSDVAFSFGKPVLIRFLHPEGEDTTNFTIPGDGDIVVFQAASGITMAWDTARNHCLGWRPDGLGDESRDWEVRQSPFLFSLLGVLIFAQLFSNNEFIFYVNGSGIHGFEIPPLQPITEEHIDLSSFSSNSLCSSFFIPHIRTYDIAESECIIGPETCFPISDQQPAIYIIKGRDEGLSTFYLHWYQFRFNSSDPRSSTLTLLRTTLPNGDYESSLCPFRTYYVWGDQVAILWESEDDDGLELPHTSFYLSLFSMPRSPGPPITPRAHAQVKAEDSLTILPFARYPMAQDDDTVPVPLGHGFCPHTGKVAVHCWVPDDDTSWVDWYDFVVKD